MWSNSALAMRSHSGGRRRARAVTGGPVVMSCYRVLNWMVVGTGLGYKGELLEYGIES